MEPNGNGHTEPGSFEWLLSQRLRALQTAGASNDDVATLKARGAQMAAVLTEFRSQRRQLVDSKRYAQQGLQDMLAELAGTTAGTIRRQQGTEILQKQIQQAERKLAAPTAVEKEDKLLNYWKQMEARAHYERLGVMIVDTVAGTMTFDTVKADMLYRAALERGDAVAQEALEQWPGGSPVDAALIAEGRRQRLLARDPAQAKALTDLYRFKDAWEATVHDALSELREFLPVDDPIARQASGASSEA